ncbi:hypothetical protein M747DRAFT_15826 [Aspergillus niger ATCC 13496]|uniref:Uncharacterized protein n=1 Tax=Aspergillus niger ATCC 13496 TaxID=1353008 RepID=A0A370C5F9_ASPNG|nr:hypothetical protein M747DRAFT_15826 [Aspergillus niger ATCC 13496]
MCTGAQIALRYGVAFLASYWVGGAASYVLSMDQTSYWSSYEGASKVPATWDDGAKIIKSGDGKVSSRLRDRQSGFNPLLLLSQNACPPNHALPSVLWKGVEVTIHGRNGRGSIRR